MESLTRKNTVTITNCDSYLGMSIACHFLKESEREGRGQARIRVTTKDRKSCEKLREMGAEVIEVDYRRPETLREAFRDCDHAVLVPEMSKNMLKDTECMIEAMEREGVQHVLCQSLIGADTSEHDLQHLQTFGKIESMLENRLGERRESTVCIFRNAFVQQCFLLWAPMVEEDKRLRLNMGENGRFAPVDMCDIVCATYDIMCGEGKHRGRGFQLVPMDRRHHKQHYMITGPEALDGREVARQMTEALKERREIKYESADRREVRRYLEGLRKDQSFLKMCAEQDRNLGRLMSEVLPSLAGAPEAEKHRRDKDRYHGGPRREHLNETKIETILDMLDYARHGRSDFVSGDLEKIIDEEPENLRDFFRHHRDEFERGGRRM